MRNINSIMCKKLIMFDFDRYPRTALGSSYITKFHTVNSTLRMSIYLNLRSLFHF